MRVLLLLPLAALGCGGDGHNAHDGIADARIRAMNELAGILEGIRNKADVDAARPEIERIAQRLEEAQAEARKLGEPDPAVRARLLAAQRDVDARMEKVAQALQHDPEAMTALGQLLSELGREPAR